jgi:hypothetical protein
MTRTFTGLALWMIFSTAHVGFSQRDAPAGRPRIELFWSDYTLLLNKLPAGARKAVEREVRSIFAEAGIELSFFVGSPEDHGRSDAHAIRIVLMPRSAEGWTLPREAMGAILERNARSGTVYVFVPVVERIIGHPVDGKMIHDVRKSHALARALARVLAHEIVHAIDPDIPHGPEGSVMSDNLTRGLLLGQRLSFHESTTKRLFEHFVRPSHHSGTLAQPGNGPTSTL